MKQIVGCKALNRADFRPNAYVEVVPTGLLLEDICTSGYWSAVRPLLRPMDIIEAIAADGSFDAQIRITEISATGAMTFRVLREWRPDLDEHEASASKPVLLAA